MDYRGLVAAIIAGSLGITMIIGAVGLVMRNTPISERGLNAVIAIGSALAGGVAGYIGGRRTNG
jgi:hypothetical protein